MNRVKAPRPDHILAMLGYVLDGLRRDLAHAIRTTAMPDVPPVLRDLRSSHIRLLSLTPAEGMRISDLAEVAGMSKQSLGEFATALEDDGLLESLRDPADKRVRIVRPTPLGLRVVEAATALMDEVEAGWRERIGPEEWDRLRELLAAAETRGPLRRG